MVETQHERSGVTRPLGGAAARGRTLMNPGAAASGDQPRCVGWVEEAGVVQGAEDVSDHGCAVVLVGVAVEAAFGPIAQDAHKHNQQRLNGPTAA